MTGLNIVGIVFCGVDDTAGVVDDGFTDDVGAVEDDSSDNDLTFVGDGFDGVDDTGTFTTS